MNHRPYPNRDDANRAARENEIEQDRREHVARCADTPTAGSLTVRNTPRTDKVTFLECGEDMFVVVQADFARELEREIARLEKQASSYAAQTCLAITRADEAEFQRKKVERKNAALREAGEALRNALAFECQKLGDRPREIDAWDALISHPLMTVDFNAEFNRSMAECDNARLRGVLEKIANLPTDQLASGEQCLAVVLAMDALTKQLKP